MTSSRAAEKHVTSTLITSSTPHDTLFLSDINTTLTLLLPSYTTPLTLTINCKSIVMSKSCNILLVLWYCVAKVVRKGEKENSEEFENALISNLIWVSILIQGWIAKGSGSMC
jgi:hypothetical protein